MASWRDSVARARGKIAQALGSIYDIELIQRAGAVDAITGEQSQKVIPVKASIEDRPELLVAPGGDQPARDAIVSTFGRYPIVRVGDAFRWGGKTRRVIRVSGHMLDPADGSRVSYRAEVV